MASLKYAFVLLIFLALAPLKGDGCQFWFGVSSSDPSPITQLEVSPGNTFTLYAWISADQPSWDWIGAVGFPIVFDTSYLEIISATFNSELGPTYSPDSLYMFGGVDWPGMGQTFADTLESQLLWYISVCFSGCLSSDGTPHYLGSVTFLAKNAPESSAVVIDTLEYPPSNNALVVDNTGWSECSPSWSPFVILPVQGGVNYVRGDINADAGINVTDAVYMLQHLYPPTFPCQKAADVNLDSTLNVTDITYFLDHLFPPQFPPPDSCGINSADILPCDSFPPCGGKVTQPIGRGDIQLFLGKSVNIGNGLVSVPVIVETPIRLAAFQFELSYDFKKIKVVEITDRGTESEKFDYFDSYRETGKIMAAGIVSLQLSLSGEASGWMEPGRHEIARLIVECQGHSPDFVPTYVLFSDIFARSIVPASLLKTDENAELPSTYSLSQNEPNPFDGSTVIRYALPVDSRVELVIYNAAGQRVRTLVRGYQSAGYKSVRWDGRDSAGKRVSPGVYFYKFKAGDFKAIKKLILAK